MVSILLWVRLAYFLKIYEGIGHYIRLIEGVLKEMKYFIIIYFISVLAFTQAQYVLIQNSYDANYLSLIHKNPPDQPSLLRVLMQIFRTSLGDIQADSYENY